ncbi:MAG: HAD family phosphatase [Prevotellaceae bacterium]|jgi:HAD superfamily hydrolase (TIGR01509 family)|nr:HAD family phosphatase [Prevotellaceae bacterium]
MNRFKAILFDFDGVIADTEPQYSLFFDRLAASYRLGKDFSARIKGATLAAIMEKYFGSRPPEERAKIMEDHRRYERQMHYTFIPGAREALFYFKSQGCKIALVTSSPDEKMKIALCAMKLENVFDAIVTADRITRGKPDPMCYLLAAATLHVSPAECVVFEDSIAGITAGKNAGMKVVALSTTLPAESLLPYADTIIPDFSELKVESHELRTMN